MPSLVVATLLVRTSARKHLDDMLSESKLLRKLSSRHDPLLGLWLRFRIFFKDAVSRIVHLELLITAAQQQRGVFRIALANLRA